MKKLFHLSKLAAAALCLAIGTPHEADAGAYDLLITVKSCDCSSPLQGRKVTFVNLTRTTVNDPVVYTTSAGQAVYEDGQVGDIVQVLVDIGPAMGLGGSAETASWEFECIGPIDWKPIPQPGESGDDSGLCQEPPIGTEMCVED